MHAPANGGEAEAGAPTPAPKRGKATRYFYLVERGPREAVGLYVSDHATDGLSLHRQATEEEVLALIGQEMLREAQDECAWNGLGSTYRVACEGAVFGLVMVGSGRNRRAELELVGHRETGPVKPPARGRRTRGHRKRGQA